MLLNIIKSLFGLKKTKKENTAVIDISYGMKDKEDNNLNDMKEACTFEIDQYRETGLVPSPRPFERVAILSRKIKDYGQEIEYCEIYIGIVDEYMKNKNALGPNISVSPVYLRILKRLPKAKELLKK